MYFLRLIVSFSCICLAACSYRVQPVAPEVKEQRAELSVSFAETRKNSVMCDADAQALTALTRIVPPAQQPRIIISTPNQPRSYKSVHAWLVLRGYDPASITPENDESLAHDEAVVEFIYNEIVTAECEYYTHSASTTFPNHPFPGAGCASAHNLARMVAEPEDLSGKGITDTHPNTLRSTAVMEGYLTNTAGGTAAAEGSGGESASGAGTQGGSESASGTANTGQ